MNDDFVIAPLTDDPVVMGTIAAASLREWAPLFPDDTVDTYIALYRDALGGRGLPAVWVALDARGRAVGTSSLVEDDELPGATEPGPWVAAVRVDGEWRGRGVGRRLVEAAVAGAARLGHDRVWIYSHDAHEWYASMGWRRVRTAELAGRAVVVMTRTTGAVSST